MESLWYCGQDEAAFLAALEEVALRQQYVCLCFPWLSSALAQDCFGDEGAVLYFLTRPFPFDVMDVLWTDALPLVDYDVTDYFTLASSALGRFADLAQNPLRPILQRCFGPDLDMQQTDDMLGWLQYKPSHKGVVRCIRREDPAGNGSDG